MNKTFLMCGCHNDLTEKEVKSIFEFFEKDKCGIRLISIQKEGQIVHSFDIIIEHYSLSHLLQKTLWVYAKFAKTRRELHNPDTAFWVICECENK